VTDDIAQGPSSRWRSIRPRSGLSSNTATIAAITASVIDSPVRAASSRASRSALSLLMLYAMEPWPRGLLLGTTVVARTSSTVETLAPALGASAIGSVFARQPHRHDQAAPLFGITQMDRAA